MNKKITRPGFIKRLAVVIYDALLLAGVLFFCLVITFGIGLYLFKVINGTGIQEYPQSKAIVSALVIVVALILANFFYGWFWTKGGQTLGMRAWHLYLIDENGKFIDWKTARIRFLVAILSWACAGMGFAWILVNRKNLAWHDIATKTQIVKHQPNNTKRAHNKQKN